MGLRVALRQSSEGGEDASNQASVAAAADWWHLRRGNLHGVSCVKGKEVRTSGQSRRDSERAEGRSVLQGETVSPDPAEQKEAQDDLEAGRDFWSVSVNFFHRHHVQQ